MAMTVTLLRHLPFSHGSALPAEGQSWEPSPTCGVDRGPTIAHAGKAGAECTPGCAGGRGVHTAHGVHFPSSYIVATLCYCIQSCCRALLRCIVLSRVVLHCIVCVVSLMLIHNTRRRLLRLWSGGRVNNPSLSEERHTEWKWFRDFLPRARSSPERESFPSPFKG